MMSEQPASIENGLELGDVHDARGENKEGCNTISKIWKWVLGAGLLVEITLPKAIKFAWF